MIDEILRFESFWRELPVDAARQNGKWIHPQDEPFVKAGNPGSTNHLHLQMPPIPANGSVRHADIVLFMLNPNFDVKEDEIWRKQHPEEAAVLDDCITANLKQLHQPGDRAFYDVRSDLKQSPGASYWKTGGGFSEVAQQLANQRAVSLDVAYDEISRRVVILQLLPYRSKTFGHDDLINRAPSSIRVQALAHYLAKHTDKLLVVQRRIKSWGFGYPSQLANVVVYPTNLAMSASLSFGGGPGGLPIFNKLVGRPLDTPLSSVKRFFASDRMPKTSCVAPAKIDKPVRVERPSARQEPTVAVDGVRQKKSWSPDRTDELRMIYGESGLNQFLTSNGTNPPGKGPFSKLKFVTPNTFCVNSIELYDLKSGDRYFRVHYSKTPPQWLLDELYTWSGLREGSRTSGMDFTIRSTSEVLMHAKSLALLLGRHA